MAKPEKRSSERDAQNDTIESIIIRLRSGEITVAQANEMLARMRARLDVVERVASALVD